jgi:hypothetical protein
MRKLFGLAFSCVLAVALLVLGSPAANAFGSEVLGCAFVSDGLSWTANSCAGGGGESHVINHIQYSPHNLSGTYSMHWTAGDSVGNPITATCSTGILPCIESGCTSTSTTCAIETNTPAQAKTYTASLQLTQFGQTRTIRASATVEAACRVGYC